jgi:8-oxo-dGTP pyrophosphatase MutT (NUDIX family)
VGSSRRPIEERSAGGIVVRSGDAGLQVLLIRDPYRNWGLPKGHLEQGEDAAAAALREVREETGLDHIEMGPELGSIDWYFRQDERVVHKFCSFFLMRWLDGEAVPEIAEGITECVWLSPEEAMARVTYDNAREMIRAALNRLETAAAEDGGAVR